MIALILLLSVTLFVILNSGATIRTIDEMLALTDELPLNSASLDYEKSAPYVHALAKLWDEKFPIIAFTAGYTNTNRCDEALGALVINFQNRNADDFTAALLSFRDALLRLHILEGVHIEGIF